MVKKVSIIFMIMILMFMIGCTTLNPSMGLVRFGKEDSWKRDTIDGQYQISTLLIVPLGLKLSSDDDMALKIGKSVAPNKEEHFFFRAEVHSFDWQFSETIALKIDDEVYRLKDNSPSREVFNSNYVIEILSFDISDELLKAIKSADTFRVELLRRVVSLEPGQIQRVKAFLNDNY